MAWLCPALHEGRHPLAGGRTDERHNTPNGLALKKLCERAYSVFGQTEYERLAGISVSHLYNLRQSPHSR